MKLFEDSKYKVLPWKPWLLIEVSYLAGLSVENAYVTYL